MKWLIWKEYRLQWLVLLVSLVLLALPYVLPLLAKGHERAELLRNAPMAALLLFVVSVSMLGGNAIATERADRSAEFLGFQPIPRYRILLSKLALPLAAASVIWTINLTVLAFRKELDFDLFVGIGVCAMAAFSAFSAFGVAWLVSSFQNSPTFAIGAGIATPLAIGCLIGFVSWLELWPFEAAMFIGFAIIAGLTGLLSFLGGCSIYLQRVEP